MALVITPLHLEPTFPGYNPIFFGRSERVGQRGIESGYVAIQIEFPRKIEPLEFRIDDENSWRSSVISEAPNVTRVQYFFRSKSEMAAQKDVLRTMGDSLNGSDIFHVLGETPLLSLDTSSKQAYIEHPPVFSQTMEMYAGILRKSAKAFEKIDNLAARDAISQLCRDTRQQANSDCEEYSRTQKLLSDAFKILIKSILEQRD